MLAVTTALDALTVGQLYEWNPLTSDEKFSPREIAEIVRVWEIRKCLRKVRMYVRYTDDTDAWEGIETTAFL